MVMMKCGHESNSTFNGGYPGCAICAGTTPDALIIEGKPLDLTNREARCHCGITRPSYPPERLAFFEYRGEGSRSASICKVCGCVLEAHTLDAKWPELRKCTEDNTYQPRGDIGYDSFYCGCDGWD